jgi:hypothetical protein
MRSLDTLKCIVVLMFFLNFECTFLDKLNLKQTNQNLQLFYEIKPLFSNTQYLGIIKILGLFQLLTFDSLIMWLR